MATKKVQRVLFSTNYYESGAIKYQAGYHYPVTDETKTRILAGDADYTTVDMDPDVAAAEQTAAVQELNAERAGTIAAEAAAASGGDAVAAPATDKG